MVLAVVVVTLDHRHRPEREPSLPNTSNWRFDSISSDDTARASALEAAGSPSALVEALGSALADAVTSGRARFGREEAEARPEDCRAVVQFPITAQAFDWFFNGRTGYRAHFRAQAEWGLRFNAELVEAIVIRLNDGLSVNVRGRQLNSSFANCGGTWIAKSFILESLAPALAKIWFCTKLIGLDSGVTDLPPGITGPKLLLAGNVEWVAPYRDEKDAWLDVKGAFLGKAGPYQPKSPTCRAYQLHERGTA